MRSSREDISETNHAEEGRTVITSEEDQVDRIISEEGENRDSRPSEDVRDDMRSSREDRFEMNDWGRNAEEGRIDVLPSEEDRVDGIFSEEEDRGSRHSEDVRGDMRTSRVDRSETNDSEGRDEDRVD